jgi:hypothetical protein
MMISVLIDDQKRAWLNIELVPFVPSTCTSSQLATLVLRLIRGIPQQLNIEQTQPCMAQY